MISSQAIEKNLVVRHTSDIVATHCQLIKSHYMKVKSCFFFFGSLKVCAPHQLGTCLCWKVYGTSEEDSESVTAQTYDHEHDRTNQFPTPKHEADLSFGVKH
jgi:hypothetical protein